MRPQDVAEMQALGHTDMAYVVRASIDASAWCLAALVAGELVCIFGVGPHEGAGGPWMLGTPLVKRHRRNLARLAPHYIRLMLRDYVRLVNWVHADNTVAIAWLRRMGFTLHDPVQVPHTGALFHPFEMHANGDR